MTTTKAVETSPTAPTTSTTTSPNDTTTAVDVARRVLWDWQGDPGRSPRDTRRIWTRLLPLTPAFRNPAARFLAEWADAILFLETWAAWTAAHPDAGDVLPAGGAS